ncbi:MAG TPA: hypothetical protein VFN55_13730 [Solirubrobacteraceae bacterium]|nr:hypothetical protein [Solirubrobacteraceae bacterium]
MRALKASLGVAIIVAALTSLLGFTVSAGARSCYINTKARYPTVTSPCNKATISSGAHVVFKVRDLNSSAYKYHPFLVLTPKAPKHGIVPSDVGGNGLYDELKPVKGHHGQFQDKPHLYTFPGYWNVTPGKYYIQVHQIESGCTTRHCTVYSPVTTITVK